MNDRQLKELILAAKGKLPFDIYFYKARIVDVYRERIIDNGSVGIKNGIIAAVCPDFEPRAAEFIDCRGMYLAPSFIDAHMHIESSKLTPFAYCEGAVPHGTGCVFFDPMQMSNTLGLKGIKLHPDYQGFMIDDERMDKIYDAIERADLPVIFHSGYDCVSPDLIHSTPERALNMIKKHPKLKVILAHLGANMMWEQVRDVLAGVDGEVYFDTAFTSMCPDELMQAIVEKHGADRILFASDCPWDSSYLIKEKILRLNISEDNKDKILGGNAERLLGLK